MRIFYLVDYDPSTAGSNTPLQLHGSVLTHFHPVIKSAHHMFGSEEHEEEYNLYKQNDQAVWAFMSEENFKWYFKYICAIAEKSFGTIDIRNNLSRVYKPVGIGGNGLTQFEMFNVNQERLAAVHDSVDEFGSVSFISKPSWYSLMELNS